MNSEESSRIVNRKLQDIFELWAFGLSAWERGREDVAQAYTCWMSELMGAMKHGDLERVSEMSF